jgi:hypothetical protein
MRSFACWYSMSFLSLFKCPTFRHSTLDALCDTQRHILYSYTGTRKWKSCNILIHNRTTPYVMTQFTQPQNKLFMDKQQFSWWDDSRLILFYSWKSLVCKETIHRKLVKANCLNYRWKQGACKFYSDHPLFLSLWGVCRLSFALWFQASAAILMRSALFWDIRQCRVVTVYRRFGTTYRSHLHGSRVGLLTHEDFTRRRVISQKSADLPLAHLNLEIIHENG